MTLTEPQNRSIPINDTTVYVLKRLAQASIVIFMVSILGFLALKLSPGDCFSELRSDPKTPRAIIKALEERLGYNQPLLIQYLNWFGHALSGDFGVRCQGFSPVTPLILGRAGATLTLAIASLITTWAIAIPLGIFCAVRQNTWIDRFVQVISYMLQGFPSFVIAILLLMLAQNTSLFPVGGLTSIDYLDLSPIGKMFDVAYHLVLPVLTLTIIGFAGLQRIMRGNLLDVLQQDYIRTARAKGLPENRIIYIHALRNAVNPIITLLGFEFAGLLSGSFITETFFGLPGLGKLILEAVNQKDVNLVMASLMLGTVMLVIGNLLADLLLKAVDPRIRLEEMD